MYLSERSENEDIARIVVELFPEKSKTKERNKSNNDFLLVNNPIRAGAAQRHSALQWRLSLTLTYTTPKAVCDNLQYRHYNASDMCFCGIVKQNGGGGWTIKGFFARSELPPPVTRVWWNVALEVWTFLLLAQFYRCLIGSMFISVSSVKRNLLYCRYIIYSWI